MAKSHECRHAKWKTIFESKKESLLKDHETVHEKLTTVSTKCSRLTQWAQESGRQAYEAENVFLAQKTWLDKEYAIAQ
jgi:hypothetical protein